jgi:hypothetical protein
MMQWNLFGGSTPHVGYSPKRLPLWRLRIPMREI